MCNVNPKNQLQEFCQKHSLALPKYTIERVPWEGDHDPRFQSSVTVTWDKTYNGTGDIEKTKKQAEIAAAEFMLGVIEGVKNTNIKRYQRHVKDVCVYIDLENIHIGDFFDHHEFPDRGFYFTGYATANHPSLKNIPSILNLLTVDSDHKDAADTLMIYDIGKSVGHDSSGIYVIVTKDHFAAPLVEILNSDTDIVEPIAYRCKSMEDIDSLLEQYRI